MWLGRKCALYWEWLALQNWTGHSSAPLALFYTLDKRTYCASSIWDKKEVDCSLVSSARIEMDECGWTGLWMVWLDRCDVMYCGGLRPLN